MKTNVLPVHGCPFDDHLALPSFLARHHKKRSCRKRRHRVPASMMYTKMSRILRDRKLATFSKTRNVAYGSASKTRRDPLTGEPGQQAFGSELGATGTERAHIWIHLCLGNQTVRHARCNDLPIPRVGLHLSAGRQSENRPNTHADTDPAALETLLLYRVKINTHNLGT